MSIFKFLGYQNLKVIHYPISLKREVVEDHVQENVENDKNTVGFDTT